MRLASSTSLQASRLNDVSCTDYLAAIDASNNYYQYCVTVCAEYGGMVTWYEWGRNIVVESQRRRTAQRNVATPSRSDQPIPLSNRWCVFTAGRGDRPRLWLMATRTASSTDREPRGRRRSPSVQLVGRSRRPCLGGRSEHASPRNMTCI